MIDTAKIVLAASKILEEIKIREGKITFPINPFKILNEKEVVILFSDFDKLEGLLLYDNKRSLVSINANRPITRQRFTAAHELGHLMLHSEIKRNEFLCPIYGVKSLIEKEADSFASNLLMPSNELNKRVDLYQNSNGKVGLDECLLIAEYFGVSFESCVKTICYRLKRFEYDLDDVELTRLIKKYKPGLKRKELLENTDDLELLVNAIEYSHFSTIHSNRAIGIKFIQNLVYHENRLEKIDISKSEINGIFADLRMNGSNSIYCHSNNQNIIESLGNIEMNEYCLETDNGIDIFEIIKLNKLLYKYAPFPEYAGEFRTNDNMIIGGTIQPVSYLKIMDKMSELNSLLKNVMNNIDKYNVSEYIYLVAKIHYELTVLHPFNDGNGRITRAFTNWLLRLKGLCPIYIDSDNRDDYISALQEIDRNNNYVMLEIIIIKSIIRTISECHKLIY